MVAPSFLPMKRFATLLIAAAASAHAQFAVMHTNGVVTSPTNLTIQQSNVAGLASALDSKLGTNPTLAISNTAGLQSALDGKLATNGTLAVSNVSGLQSALDGKLATNGSAAGLSGFVGTTNAETARGNLGISNTFAGQFHADFFEDYSRYTNGTVVGEGFVPTIGPAYTLQVGSSNYNAPRVVDGGLQATNGETYYLTTELSRSVYNFGATVQFDQASGGNGVTFIVSPNGPGLAIFGRMLHISVTPFTIGVDVTTNGVFGFGGTNTIILDNFASSLSNAAPLEVGVSYNLVGQIQGDTLFINWAGRTYSGRHALMTNVTGKFFTHEGFYGSSNVTNRIDKVWANAPYAPFTQAADASITLSLLDRGRGRFNHSLIVGSNAINKGVELGANAVYVEGNNRTKGRLEASIGTSDQFGQVPVVKSRGGGAANTNTTNLTTLIEFPLIGNTLYTNYARWRGTFVGSFANNTNAKRVTFNMAGNQLNTGDLNESGEWKMEAIVYASTNNSHEGFAIFQSEQTTKTARWTFNNGAGVQFNVAAQGAGQSNNDVILRGAWADVFP
jgi:hypothetical protein